jgi:hypothetical protein
MPRLTRRRKHRHDYTDHEKRVLLTGVPLSPASTRFGFPRGGWRVEEIRLAWETLQGELLPLWQSQAFDRCRERHSQPWAVRVLEGLERLDQ